jgi:hypothetical protein
VALPACEKADLEMGSHMTNTGCCMPHVHEETLKGYGSAAGGTVSDLDWWLGAFVSVSRDHVDRCE